MDKELKVVYGKVVGYKFISSISRMVEIAIGTSDPIQIYIPEEHLEEYPLGMTVKVRISRE